MTAGKDAADARLRLSDALGDLRRITSSPRLDRRVAVRSGVPIGLAAYAVLGKVIADGPVRLSDLAAAQRIHPAALTRQVQALEAEGYIDPSTRPGRRAGRGGGGDHHGQGGPPAPDGRQ